MTITETDLAKARTAWGDGLIAISTAYDAGGIDAAKEIAGGLLDSLYGFEFGPILFKPTLSGGAQTFRTDRTGTERHTAPRFRGLMTTANHDSRYTWNCNAYERGFSFFSR